MARVPRLPNNHWQLVAWICNLYIACQWLEIYELPLVLTTSAASSLVLPGFESIRVCHPFKFRLVCGGSDEYQWKAQPWSDHTSSGSIVYYPLDHERWSIPLDHDPTLVQGSIPIKLYKGRHSLARPSTEHNLNHFKFPLLWSATLLHSYIFFSIYNCELHAYPGYYEAFDWSLFV